MKNKWLAAILNILPGAGYLYTGTRTPFAVILLSLLPATVVVGLTDPYMQTTETTDTTMSWGVIVILLIPTIALMVDGYMAAIESNKK